MPTYTFEYAPKPTAVVRVYALSYEKAILAAKAKLDEEAEKPKSKIRPPWRQPPWELRLLNVEGL